MPMSFYQADVSCRHLDSFPSPSTLTPSEKSKWFSECVSGTGRHSEICVVVKKKDDDSEDPVWYCMKKSDWVKYHHGSPSNAYELIDG